MSASSLLSSSDLGKLPLYLIRLHTLGLEHLFDLLDLLLLFLQELLLSHLLLEESALAAGSIWGLIFLIFIRSLILFRPRLFPKLNNKRTHDANGYNSSNNAKYQSHRSSILYFLNTPYRSSCLSFNPYDFLFWLLGATIGRVRISLVLHHWGRIRHHDHWRRRRWCNRLWFYVYVAFTVLLEKELLNVAVEPREIDVGTG